MNKFIIASTIAAIAALMTGCATYDHYPVQTQAQAQAQAQARPLVEEKYRAVSVMLFSSLLPQAIEESARTVDTSQGPQALMIRMDMLGMKVQRKAGPCIEELNADMQFLPNCYDYLVSVAAMMAVATAAQPLMEREVRRNRNAQVQATGDFGKAGDMIAPVGKAMRTYSARNL